MRTIQEEIKDLQERIKYLEGQLFHLALELNSLFMEEGSYESELAIKNLKKKHTEEITSLESRLTMLLSQQQGPASSVESGRLNSAHMYATTQANSSQTKLEKSSHPTPTWN